MKPSVYQQLCSRTECDHTNSSYRMGCNGNPSAPRDSDSDPSSYLHEPSNRFPWLTPIRVNHSIIGMTGEVGEISNLFVQGKHADKTQMTLELGDLLWYMAESCNALGVDMDKIYNDRIHMFQVPFRDIPLGMSVVVGLMASELQRWIYYGKYDVRDKQHILNENLVTHYKSMMGYIALTLSYIGVSIEQAMEANIIKLKARYPDKYDDFHAADENRDRKAEEQHLTDH